MVTRPACRRPYGRDDVHFTSLITLVWLASWGFGFLHSVHPFSDNALQLFETLESVLIRIDAALCGVVMFRGLAQYVISVIRSDS